MPSRRAARTTLRTAALPWLCPSLRASPRCFAHRPFPSMMMPTCLGSSVGSIAGSDVSSNGRETAPPGSLGAGMDGVATDAATTSGSRPPSDIRRPGHTTGVAVSSTRRPSTRPTMRERGLLSPGPCSSWPFPPRAWPRGACQPEAAVRRQARGARRSRLTARACRACRGEGRGIDWPACGECPSPLSLTRSRKASPWDCSVVSAP